MEDFRLGENILCYRNQKKMTQEALAGYVGVTKAAVSKWEKGQSLPDLAILPRLAALFDVSIDTLLGYEPMLKEEQILRLCGQFAQALDKECFADVFEKIRETVRRYYSCYPFLIRICTLMISRYTCAQGEEAQQSVLEEIRSWCDHIIRDCRETRIIQRALSIHTLTDYCMGHYEAVIETLTKYNSLIGMSNSNDLLLIRSYIMLQEGEKADKYTRMVMDKSALNLIECGTLLLQIKRKEKRACEEILRKTDLLIQTEELARRHAYEVMQYQLLAAFFHADQGQREEMYGRLEAYAGIAQRLLAQPDRILPDTYLKRILEWTDAGEIAADLEWAGFLDSLTEPLANTLLDGYRREARFESLMKGLEQSVERSRRKWKKGSDSTPD